LETTVMPLDHRQLLRYMFDGAVAAAQPSLCVFRHLPAAPKGRLMVIGAGKASAAMARAVEDQWTGPLTGLVVTRYGYSVPCQDGVTQPSTRSTKPTARWMGGRGIWDRRSRPMRTARCASGARRRCCSSRSARWAMAAAMRG